MLATGSDWQFSARFVQAELKQIWPSDRRKNIFQEDVDRQSRFRRDQDAG